MMKVSTGSRASRLRIVCALGTFLGGLGLSAHAGAQTMSPSGPYASFGAGITDPDAEHYRVPGSAAPTASQSFRFDTGLDLTGAFGYKWINGVRTEAEIDYRHASADAANGFNTTGAEREWGAMANVLYDVPVDWVVQPYVGAGIGVGTERYHNVMGSGFTDFPAPDFNSRDSAQFQWQAIAGVNYALGPQTALFADYRYIDLENRHFNVSPLGTFTSGRDARSDNLLLGIRYFFHS